MDTIFKEYKKLKIEIDEFDSNFNPENYGRKDTIDFVKKFQKIYNHLVSVILNFEKLDSERKGDIPILSCVIDGNRYQESLLDALKYSKFYANIVQFKYLYTLTLKLSEYSELDSKKRDESYYVKSIYWAIGSFIAGVIVSVGSSYYFDNNEDPFLIDLKTTMDEKFNMVVDQDPLVKQIDFLESRLAVEKKKKDSLIDKLSQITPPNKIGKKIKN